jgi:two-component system response regulator MprA
MHRHGGSSPSRAGSPAARRVMFANSRGPGRRERTDTEICTEAPAIAEDRHVLIVDDDASILRMLRLIFQGDGFVVETATNGLEALDMVASKAPGVIVLDLEMPVMDGRECFRQLRSRGHETPVLILSAYGAERARAELSAQAYVSKPFEPDYLVQEVRRLLDES